MDENAPADNEAAAGATEGGAPNEKGAGFDVDENVPADEEAAAGAGAPVTGAGSGATPPKDHNELAC